MTPAPPAVIEEEVDEVSEELMLRAEPFFEELEQLGEMGLVDLEKNVLALEATRGNVEQALARITGVA